MVRLAEVLVSLDLASGTNHVVLTVLEDNGGSVNIDRVAVSD